MRPCSWIACARDGGLRCIDRWLGMAHALLRVPASGPMRGMTAPLRIDQNAPPESGQRPEIRPAVFDPRGECPRRRLSEYTNLYRSLQTLAAALAVALSGVARTEHPGVGAHALDCVGSQGTSARPDVNEGFTPSSRPALLPRRAVTGMAVPCAYRAEFAESAPLPKTEQGARAPFHETRVMQVRQCPSNGSNARPNRPVRMFLIVTAITGDSVPMRAPA